MARIDQRHQPRRLDMRIDLGGGDIGMAEQGLKHPQIRPTFKQMSGKGMAQHVRADGGRIKPDARRAPSATGTAAPGSAACHPSTKEIARGRQAGAQRDPARQCSSARAPTGTSRVVPPLAGDGQKRRITRHRHQRQRHQFARAQARSIEQFDQRKASHGARFFGERFHLGAGEQRGDLFMAQHLGQRAPGARGRQRARRIVAPPPFVDREPVKLPQRRGLAGNAAGASVAQTCARLATASRGALARSPIASSAPARSRR